MEKVIYFLSEIIIAIGAVAAVTTGLKTKEGFSSKTVLETAGLKPAKNDRLKRKKAVQSPKRQLFILNATLFIALLSFLPFISDFIKLSGLQDSFGLSTLISITPFDDYTGTFLGGSVIISPLNTLFKFLIIFTAFFTSVLSVSFVKVLNQKITNFTALFLFAVLGGLFLCSANDFLTLFISIEIISTALFFLIANFSDKKEEKKQNFKITNIGNGIGYGAPLEASVKYCITGAISSCFMLLAISYIYLHLGTLNFSDMEILAVNKLLPQSPLLNAAEVIFFLALVFKIGAYPFYLWVMDVFKGVNYSTGLFISTMVETAGFAAIIKSAFALGFFGSIPSFALILCAVLTLVLGNLFAFRTIKKEGSIKDFLASSSIANSGYALLGISFFAGGTICASIFFFIVYLVMNIGLWAGFMLVAKNLRGDIQKDTETIPSLRGLAYISPSFAAAFTICLLSFAGFPVMAGFSAKFYLFVEILRSGVWAVYPLLFAAFASILAVYYYFKIIYYMFLKPVDLKVFKKNTIFDKTNVYTVTLMLSAAALIVLFFFSGPVIRILQSI